MSAFEDIGLSWQGRDYTIPANRVMGAIARVEDHVTFNELTQYAERNTAPMAKLAQAFASVLRYAGAPISDEDVYEGMFAKGGDPQSVMNATMTLLALFIPKSAIRPSDAEDDGREGKQKPAGTRSSRRRSRRRSAKRKS